MQPIPAECPFSLEREEEVDVLHDQILRNDYPLENCIGPVLQVITAYRDLETCKDRNELTLRLEKSINEKLSIISAFEIHNDQELEAYLDRVTFLLYRWIKKKNLFDAFQRKEYEILKSNFKKE